MASPGTVDPRAGAKRATAPQLERVALAQGDPTHARLGGHRTLPDCPSPVLFETQVHFRIYRHRAEPPCRLAGIPDLPQPTPFITARARAGGRRATAATWSCSGIGRTEEVGPRRRFWARRGLN